MPRRALAVLLLTLAGLAAPSVFTASSAHAADPGRENTVVLAFLPRTVLKFYDPNAPKVLDRLDARKQLALGLVSATQGRYSQAQAMLDLTSGTRASLATYTPHDPPELTFAPIGDGVGIVFDFAAAVVRATTAPADIRPGLLAQSVPGGIGYVGFRGAPDRGEAIAAAEPSGIVPDVSIGSSASLAGRTQALLLRHRAVVVGLPQGPAGGRGLDDLLATRRPHELLLVIQTPPISSKPQLLPIGAAGPGFRPGAITSETTHRQGIVALIDVLPTVLHQLGIAVPSDVRGERMTTEGTRDAAGLKTLASRLSVILARRMPALQVFLFGWLALVLALGIWRDRAGVRMGLRIGGLGLMWLPSVLLFTALLAPSRPVELVLIGGVSLGLAFVTDALVPWPRAPAVPGLAGLLFYGIDLASSSELIVRSLLGPNPRSGSRFYGIGNELEIGLTLLFLIGLAAALPWRERSRRTAGIFAGAGFVVTLFIASGRLGADVGGVFTVGSGAAAAVLLLVPGGANRKRVALAFAVPVVGLALLALLDTLTGGEGHFSKTVLHAHGVGDLEKTLRRRSELALNNLVHGLAPVVTGIALLAVGYALRHRDRVYAAIAGDPVWEAALVGGLVAAVVGSLTNDSGPILLIVGVTGLAGVTAYLRSAPT